jgi:putative intracellular protease/amidase
MKKNVGILLFDQVEALDFAGPFEVFFSRIGASSV